MMPPSLPQWQAALAVVDIRVSAPVGSACWRYWFPEARTVIHSDSVERRRRYLLNWLRLREHWLYLLDTRSFDDDSIVPLRVQEWREYLNISESTAAQITKGIKMEKIRAKKAAEMKQTICHLFHGVFQKDILACPVPETWFGRSLASLQDPDCALDDPEILGTLRLVTWELHELAFRYELTELDLFLTPSVSVNLIANRERHALLGAVFPSAPAHRLNALPNVVDGLASQDRARRAPFLEALRRVVSRWPQVSISLKDCPPFTVIESAILFDVMEMELAKFYCQTFFQVAGRAPVVPRRLPTTAPPKREAENPGQVQPPVPATLLLHSPGPYVCEQHARAPVE